MTIPLLMNCSHQSDGWCLECLGEHYKEYESLRQQLADVTAELEAARAAASAEATFADEMKAERDAYASTLRRCAVAATVSDSATEDEAVQAAGKAAFETALDGVDDIVSDRIADLIFDAAQVTAERDRLLAVIDVLKTCRSDVKAKQVYHAVLAAVAETKGASDGK